MKPLTADVAVYILVAAIVLWWLLGPSVSNTVDLGANAKIGGRDIDTRYRSPLETAPYESPPALPSDGVAPDAYQIQAWVSNPFLDL